MLSLRPKCKECNDESWVKGLCYKHYQLIKNKKPKYYKRSNLQRRNMTKLPKHIEERYNERFPFASFTWNGDNKIGRKMAEQVSKDIKSFIATILEEEWKEAIKLFIK